MKEEKIYNVRYSECKGKIKLYLEPKKLVFKKTKGLFKKETIIADTILLDDIKTKRNEVNLDIDYNEVCIETKDKFILITFDEIKDVDNDSLINLSYKLLEEAKKLEKIKGRNIFRPKGLQQNQIVVSLAVAESILRRNPYGVSLKKVEMR